MLAIQRIQDVQLGFPSISQLLGQLYRSWMAAGSMGTENKDQPLSFRDSLFGKGDSYVILQ